MTTSRALNIIEHRFGRLVVLSRSGTNNSGAATWNCKCDCGSECVTHTTSLTSGHTQSCGCITREQGNPIESSDGVLLYPCVRCRNYKDSGEFHKSKSTKTGFQLYCIPCAKLNLREWQEKNPDKLQKQWDRGNGSAKEKRVIESLSEKTENTPDGKTLVLCGKCKEKKDSSLFYRSYTALTGYQNWCVACQKDSRERSKLAQKAWKLENHDRVKELSKKYSIETKTKRASLRLQKIMGITLEEKWKTFEEQGKSCAACGSTYHGTRGKGLEGWCADHDHSNSKFRGVLCGPCNKALGMCEDSISRLQNLIDYLRKSSGKKEVEL